MEVNAYKVTLNEVLNKIFAGYIHTDIDVLRYISNTQPDMNIGDAMLMVDELRECGKIY